MKLFKTNLIDVHKYELRRNYFLIELYLMGNSLPDNVVSAELSLLIVLSQD